MSIASAAIIGFAPWQTFVAYFTEFINLAYSATNWAGFPSYGLAIILITLVIKLALFPLTHKQMKSMRAMQALQPKVKWLQEKYADDPKMSQQKMMELYKEHGVNPLGGCLPLLIQMPIFIAFYQALMGFQFVNAAHSGFLVLKDISLSAPMAYETGGIDMAWPYWLLIVLAALTTFIQQRISMVESNDPTQKSMLYFMPVFMGWIAYKLPAGLPLYWVTFNTLGIIQQLIVNRSAVREEAEKKEKAALEEKTASAPVLEKTVKAAPAVKLEKDETGAEAASKEEAEEQAPRKTAAQQNQSGKKGGTKNGKGSNRRKKGQKR